MSERRERIVIDRTFTPDQFAKIKAGHIPQEMEDKWFVYFDEGWLHFHRSWTGYCIFLVKLVEIDAGWQIAEAWVSRDESRYQSQDVEEDLDLLTNVFRWSLGI